MEIVFDFKYEVDEVNCEIEQSPLCGNIDLVVSPYLWGH